MKGLLVLALLPPVTLLLWLDRLCQKTLGRVLPELDQLQSNPATFLAGQEVTFRPKSRYVETLLSSVIWTFLTLIPLAIFWAVAMEIIGQPVKDMPEVVVLRWIGAMVALCFLGSLLGSYYLLGGGYLVLTRDGLEVRHRKGTVFCPWSLFNVLQKVAGWDGGTVRLGVDGSLVPSVVLRKDDRIVGTGKDVSLPHFRWGEADTVVMTDDYEVKPDEWCALLVYLGAKLGRTP